MGNAGFISSTDDYYYYYYYSSTILADPELAKRGAGGSASVLELISGVWRLATFQ